MKSIPLTFLKIFLGINGFFITFLVMIFGFDQPFLLGVAGGAAAGYLSSALGKWVYTRRFLKRNGITIQDYRYIEKNLKEAKTKIKRLQKTQFQVRSLGAFKQILELNRLSRRIYTIVRKEPKKFYHSEQFFFYHLDSVVELSEKYTYLATQPIKNDQVFQSIKDAKRTLHSLEESLQEDLMNVLSNDIQTLDFELDVARKNKK
ncbi:5-bromo-4-chloroindolyl phosphate hydrolysis family protein [Bacillus sp. SG-1]|uniref:5-bromo-4-chloroindolyl phosphate hydrolysis family protein n=1 Tax=Bacillus sp. SG-1 TaxID=161544 RepID=UPI0001543B4F|nr:5-bromo-4-chloroindolyl phosphate hydrolysis family protein [Bacillus sp. SG-1]EDL66174.1 5-bromo-4-chloroindolyl phosphate hydrolysis protein [Bacillus sp. SG-1]